MAASVGNRSESYLGALFEFGCKARGAQSLMGAPTTVAGDERATMPRAQLEGQSCHF